MDKKVITFEGKPCTSVVSVAAALRKQLMEPGSNGARRRIAAVKRLYQYQTADEQSSEHSYHRNNQGYTGVDAKKLTIIAKKLLHDIPLEKEEWVTLKVSIPKYAKQLVEGGISRGLIKHDPDTKEYYFV